MLYLAKGGTLHIGVNLQISATLFISKEFLVDDYKSSLLQSSLNILALFFVSYYFDFFVIQIFLVKFIDRILRI